MHDLAANAAGILHDHLALAVLVPGTAEEPEFAWESLDTSGDVLESVTYAYNLQGRLAQATIVKGGDTTVLDYAYDDSGIRVSQTETINAGTPVVTQYLVDANNHTGYQQVLEEFIDAVLAKSYSIGLDVLAQTNAGTTPETYQFLYDAHGSTRALLDSLAIIAQTYAYDAYGNALGFNTATALTSLLYSGEQFDQKLAMQYLRARYYDAGTGRFNRVDPFAGITTQPLSLHKYSYASLNPVIGSDPTGWFTYFDHLTACAIRNVISAAYVGVQLGAKQSAEAFDAGLSVEQAIIGPFVDQVLGPIDDFVSLASYAVDRLHEGVRFILTTTGVVAVAEGEQPQLTGAVIMTAYSSARRPASLYQGNHLNQYAAFKQYYDRAGYSRDDGVMLDLFNPAPNGLAIGEEHHRFHTAMDDFFDGFRASSHRPTFRPPTVAEYNDAMYRAIESIRGPHAAMFALKFAKAEQSHLGMIDSTRLLVPNRVTARVGGTTRVRIR